MQQQQPIQFADWHRILAGTAPWTFLIEVGIRAAFTYLLLMVAMRLLGKRIAAQLTLFELSMIVTLAAIIGIPLQVPDRGLLPSVMLVGIVILLQRALALWGLKWRRIDLLTTGDVMILMRDGRMLLGKMEDAVLSREKIYSVLRGEGIQHLGQVERLYLESSGSHSKVSG
jgi:uncharacterized membrane protein YcaP (DUF421 family)